MSAQSWTPAPKPGLIPLHPLSFGALLGKPFAALRHNPKVLFGFAIVIQLIVAAITAGVIGTVMFATFMRLESISPSSPDFYPVMWGTIAINGAVALVMGLVSLAFTAVMQGIVAANIGYAALGEKASLGRLWRLMRPAFWPLIAWSLLQSLATLLVVAIIGGIIALGFLAGAGGSASAVGLTVVVGILVVLAMIPLGVWLATKLLLVPSVLVLERVGIRHALVRSWRLTRGRFWNTFAVMLLIGLIMNTAVGLVSVPLSLLGSMIGGVIAPGGPNEASEIGAFALTAIAPQLLTYVLQAVAIVVQCAAAAFIYLDCRMRYEGLDHSLIGYLDRRDRGVDAQELGDPFAVDPERAIGRTPPPQQQFVPPYQQPYQQPYQPAGYAPPGPPPAPAPPTSPPPTSRPPAAPGQWAPPGSGSA
ncbi:glycerophosphoryl diester phosphodiesterase membrane domain-containing protein [Microbacterium sp. A94]|uniref:glycerophosphoryl diester phosphodiesterase membrane domain-containing protein n=1 Tax=Microbacterium sp. A94 TaxID=3450717 RepID=UPI003F43A3ED